MIFDIGKGWNKPLGKESKPCDKTSVYIVYLRKYHLTQK